MTQLSHIEILPTALEGMPSPNQTWAPALVLTVRSYQATEASAYNQDQQSIVDRWEVLNEQAHTLHTAFEQLGSRTGSNGAAPVSYSLSGHESMPTLTLDIRP
jgi:mediator of RNA polymerase II transcription subunit 16